ncbi:hypothetical protein [Arthrobacter sp. ERGS1:01]|uniref:hypothetical protein n=1 Tax=Arthrobacter sp. ERGS1:01 TaxID=1704044 RepID=UPI000A908678|nr:hypothetical protein [Arthrobacter sp. ERGS1:01]
MSTHDSSDLPEIHEGGYGSPTVEEEMPDPTVTNAGENRPSADDDEAAEPDNG